MAFLTIAPLQPGNTLVVPRHEVDHWQKVDPGLMGGATTRVGSTVYDGSLRTQLDRLRRKMAEE